MAHIFLSYANQDSAIAARFARVLSDQGWSVWWDRTITPGTDFEKAIQTQLTSSKCVIVLWSSASVNSHWVKDEAKRALKQEKLVPVLVEPVEIPLGFGGIEAANLIDWDDSTDIPEFEILLQAITNLAQTPTTSDTSSDLSQSDQSQQVTPSTGTSGPDLESGPGLEPVLDPSPPNPRAWLLGSVVLLFALLGLWGLDFFPTQSDPTERIVIGQALSRIEHSTRSHGSSDKGRQPGIGDREKTLRGKFQSTVQRSEHGSNSDISRVFRHNPH